MGNQSSLFYLTHTLQVPVMLCKWTIMPVATYLAVGWLTLFPAALGQLAQHFLEGKIIQNLLSIKKFGKFMYSTKIHFTLICYFT